MTRYGFELWRGDLVVGHIKMHAGDPPQWATAIDGHPIEDGTQLDGDFIQNGVASACRQEQARYRRSRSKLGGDDCRIRLIVQ